MTAPFGTHSAISEWHRFLSGSGDISHNAHNWSAPEQSHLVKAVGCGSRRGRPGAADQNPVPEEPESGEAGVARAMRESPRTELRRRLWAARERVLAESGPPLDWEGVEAEIRERRGETYGEDV
jgi:hypothetical protein